MSEIRLRAYGKINLGLDVVGKRPDGYHEIDTVLQTIGLYDLLSFKTSEEKGVRLSANLSWLPTDENNLVCKAVRMMQQEYDLPGGMDINLHKFLPVSAGMGGGSSDAAAALTAVNKLYSLNLSQQELRAHAAKLGADVPFCLAGGTCHAEGIGEILTELPSLPPCFFVIVKPPFHMSTRRVYESLPMEEAGNCPHVDMAGVIAGLKAQDLDQIAGALGNVLESVTVAAFPKLSEIKEVLEEEGALRSLMTGSGPAVYGIFRSEAKARAACRRLASENRAYVTRPMESAL